MRVMITWLSKTVRLHYQTAESVAAIQRAILEARHGFIFHAEPWTEILESRNFIAARFLQSNADILVGIDNDVGVSREAFERMLAAEVDFVGAEPPARVQAPADFSSGIRMGGSGAEAQRFVVSMDGGAGRKGSIRKVERIEPGFFVMRRAPLEALVKSGAVVSKDWRFPGAWSKETWGFYDPMEGPDGESLPGCGSFCARLCNAGFDIHEYVGPGVTRSFEVTVSS